MGELLEALGKGKAEYEADYRPEYERLAKAKKAAEADQQAERLSRVKLDIQKERKEFPRISYTFFTSSFLLPILHTPLPFSESVRRRKGCFEELYTRSQAIQREAEALQQRGLGVEIGSGLVNPDDVQDVPIGEHTVASWRMRSQCWTSEEDDEEEKGELESFRRFLQASQKDAK